MSNVHSTYLKEMGITEWVSRDPTVADTLKTVGADEQAVSNPQVGTLAPRAHWWFFGSKPEGSAQLLFQNVIRVLGLSSQEWSWKLPGDDLSKLSLPVDGVPVVAFAFGGPAVQKITGERDPLPQLRETILALNTENDDDIPVVASQDLAKLASDPKEKALLWQDLLLAKSILQNC